MIRWGVDREALYGIQRASTVKFGHDNAEYGVIMTMIYCRRSTCLVANSELSKDENMGVWQQHNVFQNFG